MTNTFSISRNSVSPTYWTYAAAEAGAIIVQYNYSANTVPSLNGLYEDRDALKTASWDEIIPFNKVVGQEMEKIAKWH